LSAILAALIAVLPAAFAMWSGRQILALSDNSTVPERLLANRARNGFVTALCAATIGAIAFKHLAWALPMLVLTRLGASYSFRKQLHHESWGFVSYFSFFARLTGAVFGFWLLLAFTPWFVSQAGPFEWAVAGVFATVLLAWNEAYGSVFRAVLRARPIDDPVIVARFEEMRARCSGLPTVGLEQVDLRGGAFINAVALPSIRRPAVLLSSTLVDRMDRDETLAVIAHELAHLEYFNARRQWWLNLQGYALVAVGTLMAPVVRLVAPDARIAVFALWPVLLLGSIALRARHRQAHETASDLRAIALSGGPDALIRALTKLHLLARLPRRWDSHRERHASHPSLARRIQAIRDASGMAPPSLGETATFRSLDDSAAVTFSDKRLVWREGGSTEHAIEYRRLTMLRVDARRSGAAYLVAIDLEHRRWEMVLHGEDVARVQGTLDIVDTQLAAAAPPPAVVRPLPRVLALIALTLAAPLGQLAVVLIGALAVAWPSQPMVAATSLASVGGVVLAWRREGLWLNDNLHWTALALLVCGIGLAAVAVANKREQLPPQIARFTGLLAGLVLVTCGVAAVVTGDTLDLHHAARAWSWVSVLVLALAGAMALERRQALRRLSVALALAAFAFTYLGSLSFLNRFVSDPFLAPARALAVTTVTPTPVAEVALPFEALSLYLSPAGRYIAVGTEDEKEQTVIHAGRVGGSMSVFTADAVAFVDERRLLLLERLSGTSRLRLVDLAGSADGGWMLSVPVQRARLSLDRASQRWSLLGWNASGDIATATGIVGQDTVGNLAWKNPEARVALVSASSSEVLGLEVTTNPGRFGGRRAASALWSITDHSSSVLTTSRLELRCEALSARGEAALCLAFDGTRTRLFEVNPVTRRLKGLVSVDGRFFRRGEPDNSGWITGWSTLGSVLLRTAGGPAIRVGARDGSHAMELAIADSVIGAVFWNENGSVVRLYDRASVLGTRY
jgi:Zn-dependent protease with chaperone function